MPCGMEEATEVFVKQDVDILTFIGVCHGARNLILGSYYTIQFVEVSLKSGFRLLAISTKWVIHITVLDSVFSFLHKASEFYVALRLSDESHELLHLFWGDSASVPRRRFRVGSPNYSAIATDLSVNTTIADEFIGSEGEITRFVGIRSDRECGLWFLGHGDISVVVWLRADVTTCLEVAEIELTFLVSSYNLPYEFCQVVTDGIIVVVFHLILLFTRPTQTIGTKLNCTLVVECSAIISRFVLTTPVGDDVVARYKRVDSGGKSIIRRL